MGSTGSGGEPSRGWSTETGERAPVTEHARREPFSGDWLTSWCRVPSGPEEVSLQPLLDV